MHVTAALRIQVSDDCKALLDQLGVYEFDDRGQVEVKVGRPSLVIVTSVVSHRQSTKDVRCKVDTSLRIR